MTGIEFGNKLEERGIVQVELARKLGMDPGNLNRKLKSPNIVKQQFIEKVEAALGFKLTDDVGTPESVPYRIYLDLKEEKAILQGKYDNLLAEYNNLQNKYNKVVEEKSLMKGQLEAYDKMNPFYKKEQSHPAILNDAI